MKSIAWKGDWPLAAGYAYPSGGAHKAWDIACPVGTPLYALRDGLVGPTNDGVANNKPGANRWAGMPSNWVVLYVKDDQGRKAYAYYQHMSPGLKARPLMKVQAGDLLGLSGFSGNATGPHLHLATGFGHPSAAGRYDYLNNSAKTIYPPSKLYQEDEVAAKDVWDYVIEGTADSDGKTPAGKLVARLDRRTKALVELVAAQQGQDQQAIEKALRSVLGSLND